MGEFNSFTFLSNVTASATQQQLIATLNAVCIYISHPNSQSNSEVNSVTWRKTTTVHR